MAIAGIEQDRIKDVLARHLTPSAHITTPDRLFGRDRKLTQIDRAFNSNGRHVFIYGDRGVGKTSLALTAAYLHQHTSEEPVYVLCSESSTFSEIAYAIGINALPLSERMETQRGASTFGASLAGFGANRTTPGQQTANFSPPSDINAAADIIRYVNSRRTGSTVIVIDELERIKSDTEKVKLAEFLNSISSVQDQSKFILCGIGRTVEDLLGAHQSATRKLETIELETISHDALWNIIQTAASELGVSVSQEHLMRASILSDGFPHYVHLIAESLFWSMFDDVELVSEPTQEHFRSAVKGALERTEVEHKSAYQRATEKTKNTREYEIALWALADRTETRRQVTAIYNDSYRPLFRRNPIPEMTKDKLNQRLLTLRSEGHGSVVIGYGSGWFAFAETIMRGYVRLVAENQGVQLAHDLAK